jgi:hypothetical protein
MRTKLFAFYLAASLGSACLGYALLHAAVGDRVFGALYRMFLYHWEHPFQYIAVVCLIFASVAAIFTPYIARYSGRRRFVAIWGVMIGSVLVASVPGGVLWSIHDMQAGYFPEGGRFWRALGWGASTGAAVGWLVIAASIPYNFLGLIWGHFIMAHGIRLTVKCRPEWFRQS